jgi:hypothetical protein
MSGAERGRPSFDISGWLRGFVEGIGAAPIVLLATGRFGGAALELAALDDFTVRKLILLGHEYDVIQTSRALWISPTDSVADALRSIEDFIAADAAA